MGPLYCLYTAHLSKRCPKLIYINSCLIQCAVYSLRTADVFKRCPDLMYCALMLHFVYRLTLCIVLRLCCRHVQVLPRISVSTLHHTLYGLTLCSVLPVRCRPVQALPGADVRRADAAPHPVLPDAMHCTAFVLQICSSAARNRCIAR
jgi:hypothetical protein